MLKLLIFVLVIAAAVYFTVRLLQHDGASTLQVRRRPRPRPTGRVQGPDDDDDFLRDLDRRRRHPEDPRPDADA